MDGGDCADFAGGEVEEDAAEVAEHEAPGDVGETLPEGGFGGRVLELPGGGEGEGGPEELAVVESRRSIFEIPCRLHRTILIQSHPRHKSPKPRVPAIKLLISLRLLPNDLHRLLHRIHNLRLRIPLKHLR